MLLEFPYTIANVYNTSANGSYISWLLVSRYYKGGTNIIIRITMQKLASSAFSNQVGIVFYEPRFK